MKHIYALFFLLACAFSVHAQTITLNATLSGKVTPLDMKTNGDLTNISQSGDEGYIKYDLTSIPAGSIITAASLKFTTIAPTTNSTVASNKITTTTLDAATAGPGFFAAINAANAAFTGSWLSPTTPTDLINPFTPQGVTDLQSRLVAGQVTYGIIRGSTNVYTFAGFNNATVANRPQLIIDYTGGSPTINYTPLSSISCGSGNRTLTANITSANGVPTSGIGLPVLYFKINSGAYTAVQGVSIGGNQYTFSFGGAAVAGNVVSYYVVAQDGAATPNVASNPGGAGGLTANPPAAATPPSSPNTYTVGGTFGGTVTVGVGGTYPTLTSAVNQYNNACSISSAVVMELLDATYPSETFPITINANANASAVKNLTIRPAAGVSPTITGTGMALIKINGADFVTIDGSNNGTNSRNLTLTNTNATGTVIWIASTPTDGATNNTITNTNLKGNSGTTTVSGVLVGGSAFGALADVANNNITITNNTMIKVQNGVFAFGNAALDQNWNISGNVIGSSVVADKLGFRGIAVQNAANFTIANNTIFGVTTSTSSTSTGILVGAELNGGVVNANTIRDIKNTEPSGYGAVGILINSSSVTAGLVISNNMVSDVTGNGYALAATIQDNGYGIFVNAGAGYSIFYNTVNMNTNQTVAGLPAAFNVGSGVTAAGAINLRDNIFVNTQTLPGSERYAIYSAAANTVFSAINYNDYATTGANLGFIGVNRATLADIQAGFGGNVNSKNIMPVFVSATDLHLDPASNPTLDNVGTPVSVTTDFDNQARSGTTPDMGADEFTAVVLAVGIDYFRGSKVGGANYIDWKVNCSSDPSVTLVLERSSDGRNFKSVQSQNVTAARCAQGFNYTDAAPPAGINYYRLKTITPDGSFKYSVIVALLNKDKGFELISVSPNPVKANTILSVTSAKAGTMEMSVTNLAGKSVLNQSVTLIAGNNPINMNFATLAAGTYNITVINTDGERKTIRFVKY